MLVKEKVISDVSSRRYTVRLAKTEEEVNEALRLRYRIFNNELKRNFSFEDGKDKDDYDDQARHLIAINNSNNEIIGTYRLQSYEQAMAGIGFTSNVRFKLEQFPEDLLKNAVEVGRACISEEHRSGRVLFLLWKGLAGYLEHFNKRYLFGYACLETTLPNVALQTYEFLKKEGHLHSQYSVATREKYTLEWSDDMKRTEQIDIPPLLKNYLEVGCEVCGGPSFDREVDIIHFLILLDIEAISERTRRIFFGS